MNKRQISINMVSSIIAGTVTLGISFLLTPYLVENLGDEAYGYIGLSGSFIAIASIFTTALNSMSNRYIMIAYEKQDNDKVNEYFSSLFVSGTVLAGAFLFAGMIMTFNIEKIFNISPLLVNEVKATFAISVFNFSIITLCTVFTLAAFLENRLELVAKADLAANVVKSAFLVLVFTLLKPQIYYVTIGGVLYTIVLYIGHIFNTKKLLPNVKIKASLARMRTIKELVVSGSWNACNSVMMLLMNGLDLALANWLVGGTAMGLVSISSTLSVASNVIIVAVINSFKPTLTKTFATGNLDKLHKQVAESSRLQCAVVLVPLAGICVFGCKFYDLWLPFKLPSEIALLATITAVKTLDQVICLTVDAISVNFVLFNKLKATVLVKLVISITNVPLVILLTLVCNNYALSILIVSCLSSCLMVVYYWIAVPIIASRITGRKIGQYYMIMVQEVKLFLILIVPFSIISYFAPCNSWISFVVTTGLTGGLGYVMMFLFGLKNDEKALIYNKIKKR